VLVLIHASRGDTSKLVDELEAIAVRAPTDLDVKADLATAYGSINKWDRASAQLEQIAAIRTTDMPLFVRIADAKRRQGVLPEAIAWYGRAAKLAPESSMPGFLAAQAYYDAGNMPDAWRGFINLQKHREEGAHAEHSLAVISLVENRGSDAAWYMRRVVKVLPRMVTAWRSLIAAELMRKDHELALKQLERALVAWPEDGVLLYLAGVAHSFKGEKDVAIERFNQAITKPGMAHARAALDQLQLGAQVTMVYKPDLPRPWGDPDAIMAMLDRFATAERSLAATRATYQTQFLKLLQALNKGPLVPTKQPQLRACPIDKVAPLWGTAQLELRKYERMGLELEAAYRFIARHDDIGATAALLPNGRTRVVAAKKAYRTALADIGELRAEWIRGLGPELRFSGCNDKLLAAAVKDPRRYRVVQVDKPDPIPEKQPPRPKPRATFYVDNTGCPDEVAVWIDGTQVGQVAPGRRSALVADGGERTLCLIVAGAAQCGDRGTVRQVYLHDGWSATMHCPK
jgi:tetratricopeptide (TPR) repeat protein